MGSHINDDGLFQSDKYPTCPPGKVPLSVEDPMAQDLLWDYAQRRRSVDAEFSADLETALRAAGHEPISWHATLPLLSSPLSNEEIGVALAAIATAPTSGPYQAGKASIGAEGVDGLFEWFSGEGTSGEAHARRLALSANLLPRALVELRSVWDRHATVIRNTWKIAAAHKAERDRLASELAAAKEVLSQRTAQIGAIRAPAIAGIPEADVVEAGILCSDPQLADHAVAARLSMPWRRFLVRALNELCSERMETTALRGLLARARIFVSAVDDSTRADNLANEIDAALGSETAR